jgi:methylmalonyl-CoA mutase N-terminal domain/subunit
MADRHHFETSSGIPLQPVYGPDSLATRQPPFEPAGDLGPPGAFPFTRGIHATMYRGKPWTMRQYAGFGSAEESNRRYRFLLASGQTGLSVAFDLPTQMGRDSDHPLARGEVGRSGVAISSIDDMHVLLDAIPLADVSVSMTINAPAIIVMAFYLANAQDHGVDWKKLRGTIQNDILKEFHAQNEYVFPPEPFTVTFSPSSGAETSPSALLLLRICHRHSPCSEIHGEFADLSGYRPTEVRLFLGKRFR